MVACDWLWFVMNSYDWLWLVMFGRAWLCLHCKPSSIDIITTQNLNPFLPPELAPNGEPSVYILI